MTTTGSFTVRKSNDRGHANHGWLDSFHTFSFANYYNPKFEQFGCLRVINEDRVQAGEGFGTHSHKEFEIFSYIVSGELTHKDSMNNLETLTRGEIQFTSAGTGISHSEYNHHKKETVHFLQIWVKPSKSGLKPSYATMKFTDEQKKNKLVKILGPEESSSHIQVHNNIHIYASILEENQEITHQFAGKKGYIQVVQNGGKVTVDGHELEEGDGVFMEDVKTPIVIKAAKKAEFLLFDIE